LDSDILHDRHRAFFYNTFMRTLTGIIVCGLLTIGSPASAVWEHSPVSEATRLAAGQDVWEFGLVYTLDAMYPARFNCPAGVRVIFHVLNLSPIPIRLERKDRQESFTLAPGAYRRWDFGQVSQGDHGFDLVMPLDEDAEQAHGGQEEANRLRCRLFADIWPGDSLPYEAVWMARGARLLPTRLVLPAGRPVSLFLGATAKARLERFPVQDQLLQVKPAEVSLTEFAHPRGGKIKIPLPPAQPGELDIR
jgi:hypothetical protein